LNCKVYPDEGLSYIQRSSFPAEGISPKDSHHWTARYIQTRDCPISRRGPGSLIGGSPH